jgi:hypothetical protein
MAVMDAVVKLMADIPDVKAALRRDAQTAECPDECKRKSIGKPILRGVSFDIGYDEKKADWHCTIGIAGEIDVMCEPPEEKSKGERVARRR